MKKSVILLILLLSAALTWSAGQQETPAEQGSAAKQVLEYWHFWGGKSEYPAIKKVMDAFTAQHPEIEIKESNFGNAELRRQLELSFMAGDPPDMYNGPVGYGFRSYQMAGHLQPISDVWKEVDGENIFPEGVKSVVTWEGEAWTMPALVFQTNNVYYNVKVFNETGVAPVTNYEDFQKICNKLKASGVNALIGAGGSATWTQYALFPFVINELGPQGYKDMAQGNLEFDSAVMKKLWGQYKQYYVDNLMEGWAGYNWEEAAKPLMEGTAGMYFCQGDWFAGVLLTDGYEPVKDFNIFPAPGTSEVFIAQIGGFSVPAKAKNPEAAKLFMKHVAEPSVQQEFNAMMGGIAPNKNVSPESYDTLHKLIYAHFNNPKTTVLPNFNAVVTPDFNRELAKASETFCTDPSDAVLKGALEGLEAIREENLASGKFLDWGF